MKNIKIFTTASLLLFLFITISAFAQDSTDYDTNQINPASKSGFHFGLYIGVLFANQYTAGMYDGYGFDADGNKNNWDNSWMNQKINLQYGGYGYAGQQDQIAQQLKVDPQTWIFDQSDMPTNMRYTPAFNVGLTGRYSVDKKNAILLNVNASKLSIGGNFVILTPQSNSASATQINNQIQTFAIRGGELRLILQLGYQRLMGDNEKFNFLVEGGLNATLAKFNQNQIMINNLTIDLTQYNNSVLFPTAVPVKRPIGIGFGAFTGFGVNANMNPKTIIQFVYSPTFEKINMGINPQIKLQNGIGVRLFYNL
jgi:hypothetical protein